MAAVDFTGRKGRSSKQKRRSRSSDGRARQKGTGRRRRGSEGGGHSGLQSPISELGEGSREARDGRRRRRRKRGTQSLPRDAFRNKDDSETERGTVRGRKRERGRGRSKRREGKSRSEERVRRAEGEEPEQEEEQEVPAVEEKVEERVEEVEVDVEERVDLEREESEEDVFLPVPSPDQKLPRPKQNWEEENNGNWDVAAEYRELRKEKEQERSWDDDRDENRETELNEDQTEDDAQSGRVERPLPVVAAIDPVSQRKPFSFLTSTLSVEQLGDDESESGGSQSDASVSAASISGLSLATAEAGGRRAEMLPGPWLTPSQQRVDEVGTGERAPSEADRAGRRKKRCLLTFNRK